MINLKGFAVGNGATNWNYDTWPSYPHVIYNFNLISKELYDTYLENDCFFSFMNVLGSTMTPVCIAAFEEMQNQTAGLNWYDLYRTVYPTSINAEHTLGDTKTVMVDG
jgi:hypothetical protein